MTRNALITAFYLLLTLVLAAPLRAQVIWSEDFSDPALNGKGAYGATDQTNIIDMVGVTNWSIDVTSAVLDAADDFWMVSSEEFVGQDTDGEAAWMSKSVDITGYSDVQIAVDVESTDNLEDGDYLMLGYAVNGGAETIIAGVTNDTAATTLTGSDISGTGVVIVIRANNDGGSEQWRFDNVRISQAPSNAPPVIEYLPNRYVFEHSPLSFDVIATESIDGDSITLSASNLPSGAVFAPVTNAIAVTNTFTWNDPTPVGVYTTTFWAVDADGATSTPVVITIDPEPGEATVMLNEININPPGTDDNREYIELRGAPEASLTGLCVIVIEGDDAAGVIDAVEDLNALSMGANGLLVLGTDYTTSPPWTIPAQTAVADLTNGALENGASTFLLVTNFTGTNGFDLDTNDDGFLDNAPWDAILDGVGWTDGDSSDAVYTTAELTQSSGTLDAATRFPTNIMAVSTEAWYNGDIDVDDVTYISPYSTNKPTGAYLTPGDLNFPSSDQPPNLGSIENQVTEESNTLSFAVTATDLVDGDQITLWATDLPTGATFDPVTNAMAITNIFNWTTPTPIGVYTTTFWAADNDGSNSVSITITVTPNIESTIIISELCDPAAYYQTNRYIEIYNAGDASVDLTNYELRDYQNGAEGYSGVRVWTLSGTIASGEALVCGDTGNAQADFTIDWSNSSWNGGADDGAALYYSDTLIDLAVGATFADDSLIRTNTVCAPSATFVSDEWYAESAPGIGEGGSTPGTHVCDCPGGGDDSDGDGIPDTWEARYFGVAASTNTATGDYDEDGVNNLDEYICDSDPTNAASFLPREITNTLAVVGEVMDLQVGPPTTNSRTYDVFWSADLEPAVWTPFGLDVTGDTDGNALTLSVTNSGSALYYRTGVKTP